MLLLAVLHPLLRRAYNKFWRIDTYTQVRSSPSGDPSLTMGLSPSAAADARLESRIAFDFAFAPVYLVALYGVSVLKIYFILYLNYKIATRIPRTYVPLATWTFNLGILLANKTFNGYPLADLATFISPVDAGGVGSLVQWAAWIDSYKGLLGRWEILFNITVLRLISFNLDLYWSMAHGTSSPLEVRPLTPNSPEMVPRQLTSKRRNNSTPQHSQNATASPSPQSQPTTHSGITAPTPSTPRSSSPDQS